MMEEEIKQQAPFNLAIDTLKAIRNMIDKIAFISIGYINDFKIPLPHAQHAKYDFVEQLTIMASPLLKENQNKMIQAEFEKIFLTSRPKYTNSSRTKHFFVPAYSIEVNKQLNEINRLVQKELQVEGHFMPSKTEGSLF